MYFLLRVYRGPTPKSGWSFPAKLNETYNPGDDLLGNGRLVARGDPGAVAVVRLGSNDLRGNKGDTAGRVDDTTELNPLQVRARDER